jgi:hypothetical protein
VDPEIQRLWEDGQIRGARYTALSDACPACAEIDDDVLRTLDDPRLTVPNPACERAECRCMIFFQMADEAEAPD